jgi:hypothetical protein
MPPHLCPRKYFPSEGSKRFRMKSGPWIVRSVFWLV